MRCKSCEAENDDGAAFCVNCAAPLTAYAGGSVADADPERTARKLAALRERPPVVPVVAAMDGVLAIIPVVLTLRTLASRPQLAEDGTNYIGHAFGGLTTIVTGSVMLPLAGALIVLAWGTMTQRSWAWYGNALIIALLALRAVFRIGHNPMVALPTLAAMALLGLGWMQTSVRRWYGTDGAGV